MPQEKNPLSESEKKKMLEVLEREKKEGKESKKNHFLKAKDYVPHRGNGIFKTRKKKEGKRTRERKKNSLVLRRTS